MSVIERVEQIRENQNEQLRSGVTNRGYLRPYRDADVSALLTLVRASKQLQDAMRTTGIWLDEYAEWTTTLQAVME